MQIFAEMALRDKGIYMPDRLFQQPQIAPPLWGALVCQAAEETVRMSARCAVESEHHMCGTDQPVLAHAVQLDTLTVFQDLWPANQRDIVIVDHIKSFVQNLLDLARLEKWEACLVGSQGRKKAHRAL